MNLWPPVSAPVVYQGYVEVRVPGECGLEFLSLEFDHELAQLLHVARA